MERRYVRKNGSRVWVNLSVSLAHAAAEQREFLICVVEDITACKLKEIVPDSLTPREMEVLGHIVARRTNKETAEQLSYSASTVKLEVQHIMRKLGVENRWQAASKAVQIGLVPPSC